VGDQIKKNEISEHIACMGQTRGKYRILVGKPAGKRPTGRFRYMWDYNIKMGFQKVGWGRMNRNDLAWNRDRWREIVIAVMNFRVP